MTDDHPSLGSDPSRVVMITGAGRGLGAVIAREQAGPGVVLLLNARTAEELEGTAAACRSLGAAVRSIVGDLRQSSHREVLAKEVAAKGRLDLLVNNASELGPSPRPEMLGFSLDRLRDLYEVNLFAPLALIQLTAPQLERAGGLVVNISSDAAVAAYPGWGGYGSSKAALDLVSRTLAAEWRSAGVSVVSVDPGDLRTRMHQDAFPGEDISDRPLPEVTLPFWAWLFGQTPRRLSGQRFRAQSQEWEAVA
ncbi:MAG: SDR family oxidoreductase [Thermoplasmata archaeon]|nr:SDR family oxidoreductase [Thermoplasmata archaeon]